MKLDPRAKMVMVICLSSIALIYDTPIKLLLVLAVTVALLLFFRFNPASIKGYLKPFFPMMLVLFLLQSTFSPGGEVLLALGPVPLVTVEGLTNGASTVLRIMVITATAMLFTTFNSRDLVLGMVQWKVPYELAFMVSIALRFLPLFRDELINMVTAVQLRGVELKKVPWGQKIAMYRRLVFPVVYRVMLKAEYLAVAMEARGFRAYPRRTYLRRLSLQWSDYAVMLAFSVVTIILIVLHIN
ncbi:MAG: energy-coupling factor transporter transmembrane component T family protein [Syntrophomonadaceae bacterium]|jgi:energy-coupling factor transport system permease protein